MDDGGQRSQESQVSQVFDGGLAELLVQVAYLVHTFAGIQADRGLMSVAEFLRTSKIIFG